MSIFNYKNFFKKKEEEIKPKNLLTDDEKFNVDNYNEWFNTIYSGYSGKPGAPGIFLRTDKLSDSMISDWFDYLYIDYDYSDVIKMHDLVRNDWRKKY